MKEHMNQSDIISEFVLQASKKEGAVSFGQRAGREGYTKVFGPGANPRSPRSCHISIEHKYAAVSVSDTLAASLDTHKRRGWSAGPNLGRFQTDILLSEAKERFGSAEAFVRALVEAAREHKVW